MRSRYMTKRQLQHIFKIDFLYDAEYKEIIYLDKSGNISPNPRPTFLTPRSLSYLGSLRAQQHPTSLTSASQLSLRPTPNPTFSLASLQSLPPGTSSPSPQGHNHPLPSAHSLSTESSSSFPPGMNTLLPSPASAVPPPPLPPGMNTLLPSPESSVPPPPLPLGMNTLLPSPASSVPPPPLPRLSISPANSSQFFHSNDNNNDNNNNSIENNSSDDDHYFTFDEIDEMQSESDFQLGL